MTETWKAIPNWEGYYEVSDMGRVWSLERKVLRANGHMMTVTEKVLSGTVSRDGYTQFPLARDGGKSMQTAHRLVLESFVGPAPDGMEGCHNDGNPSNNALSNLRWDTRAENLADAVRHRTHSETRKTHCPRGHELLAPNLTPSDLARGRRSCRACARGYSFARTRKRRGVTFTPEQLSAICDEFHLEITASDKQVAA